QAATSFLGEFLAGSRPPTILGRTIDLSLDPTAMTWDQTGGRIALDATTVVRGVDGASFLSPPREAPTSLGGQGLAIALADDVANQLLAGMWAGGALAIDYLPAPGDPLLGFFPRANHVRLALALPPVINADTTTGTLHLAVGDVLVEIIDTDEGAGTLAELAVSAEIDLAAALTGEGRVMLQTGDPRVVGQVLSQAPDLLVPLDEAKVTALAELAIDRFADRADDLLSTLPIPGVPGATLTSPTFEPSAGYLLLNGSLATP